MVHASKSNGLHKSSHESLTISTFPPSYQYPPPNNPDKIEHSTNSKAVKSAKTGTNEDGLPEEEESMFQSVAGCVISCLGSAVGSGNIWRFPRIVAGSSDKGALAFYIVWIMFLFIWSIPIIMIEYTLGRFTKNSPAFSFCKFFNAKFMWLGLWQVLVVIFLSSYYPVVVGWCVYYFYLSCTLPSLPSDATEGQILFDDFAKNSYYPVLTQFLTVLSSGLCMFGGIKWIEKANIVLVPLLLLILIITFGWSLTREYAEVGIMYLFSANWKSLGDAKLWINAAGQNAFDTGAGMAVLTTYATYMTRDSKVIAYSIFIPLINNLVSLYCSFTIFSTVFSTIILSENTKSITGIVELMKTEGPGSTGLTFTWIPVLFGRVGYTGRVLCALFFLCLIFAGISSILSLAEVLVKTLLELKVGHKLATLLSLLIPFILGLPSAMNIRILANQDDTWGYALIISGFLFCVLVIHYGPRRYLKRIINDYGTSDCKLPSIWIPIVIVLVPIQCMVLISWWIYNSISNDPNWYQMRWESISTMILEWIIALVVILTTNFILYRTKVLQKLMTGLEGGDPYKEERDEEEDENQSSIKMNGMKSIGTSIE